MSRVLYWSVWWMLIPTLTLIYRLRRFHTERMPSEGAVLLAANHQSHLDPPTIATAVPGRAVHFLARSGLFRSRLFGWLIGSLNSVPIKEDSGDLGAIREIIARLETGVPVLVFPEGSRSPDGSVHEFKRGIALLLKRARCPVVPVAIEGAYDAFPRQRKWPRVWGCRLAVMIGEPIGPDELLKDGADAGLDRLRREIDTMRLELRSKLRAASGGRYPASGAGDGQSP